MSRVLYLKAESRLLNPKLDADKIAADYAEDPESARAEWGGEFRADSSMYLSDEDLDRAIVPNRFFVPMTYGYQYRAFCDPSGLKRCNMTLAVSHLESGGKVVLDKLVSVPPNTEPVTLVMRFAEVLSSFGINRVVGDAFGDPWLKTLFANHGITKDLSDLNKNEIYAQCLPLFAQGLVELLDVPSLRNQLSYLERKPKMGGGDTIDKPHRTAFDDEANAVCGSLLLAANGSSTSLIDHSSSVTRALSEIEHGYQQPRRTPSPPPGLGGNVNIAFEPDYTRAIRDYDPIN